jgi:hypothetical protein
LAYLQESVNAIYLQEAQSLDLGIEFCGHGLKVSRHGLCVGFLTPKRKEPSILPDLREIILRENEQRLQRLLGKARSLSFKMLTDGPRPRRRTVSARFHARLLAMGKAVR